MNMSKDAIKVPLPCHTKVKISWGQISSLVSVERAINYIAAGMSSHDKHHPIVYTFEQKQKSKIKGSTLLQGLAKKSYTVVDPQTE